MPEKEEKRNRQSRMTLNNFPLTASNRELCYDSFQYSTNKKKTDSK